MSDSPLKPLAIFIGFSLLVGLGIAVGNENVNKENTKNTSPINKAYSIKARDDWASKYPFWRKQDNSGMADVLYAKKELVLYFRELAKDTPQLVEEEWDKLLKGTIDERYAIFMKIRKRTKDPRLFTYAHSREFFLPFQIDGEKDNNRASYPHICRYEDEIGFLDAHPDSKEEILSQCAANFLLAHDKDNISKHLIEHIFIIYPHLANDLFKLRNSLDNEEISNQAAKKILKQITNHSPTLHLLELLHDLNQWNSTKNFYQKLMQSLQRDNPTDRVQYLWEIIHADYPQLGKTPEQLSHYLENGLKKEVNHPVSMNQFTEKIVEWMTRGFRDVKPDQNVTQKGKNGFLILHDKFSSIFALLQNEQDKDGLEQFVETLSELMPDVEKQNLWRIAVTEMRDEYELMGFPLWSDRIDQRRAILVLKLIDILPMNDIFDVMMKKKHLNGKVIKIADTGTIQGNIAAWNQAYDKLTNNRTTQQEINLDGLLELK